MKKLIPFGLMALSIASFAAAGDLKTACGADVGKLAKAKADGCKNTKDEKGIFDCVEHNEKKVSKTCYDAHETYESASGAKDND